MILVYVIGFLTCISQNVDAGLVRPLGMAPFQHRLEGVGGIDGNLPDHLEHLTAHIVGAKMNEIPIGLQAYTVGVSQKMRRVMRRVATAVIFYHEKQPIDDDDLE